MEARDRCAGLSGRDEQAVRFLIAVLLLAQASPPPHQPAKEVPKQENVRCIKDSFGNYTCTDGTRYLNDSFGNVTVIPGRKPAR